MSSDSQLKKTSKASKPLLFVFKTPPYGKDAGREGLDAVLAVSAFTDNIELIFLDDGVYQLLKHQDPVAVLSKDHSAMFKLLALCEIESVYFCSQSLNKRGLTPNDLLLTGEALNARDIGAKLQSAKQVMSF